MAGTTDRGIYKRHVKNTKQKGKKKGDLSKSADWEHGYKPKTEVAMALKAKHLSKDDLTSTGRPEQGKENRIRMPVPRHLKEFKSAAARKTQVKDTKSPGNREEKKESSTRPSVSALRRRRAGLERKVKAGTATPQERKMLNQIISELKRRSK